MTADQALLWTDSRYWNEAGLQLDSECWELQKQGLPATPTIPKWLAKQALAKFQESSKPLKVGIDPFVFPESFPKDLESAFEEAIDDEGLQPEEDGYEIKIGELVSVEKNLVDEVWGDARPAVPLSPFRVHPIEYAGVSLNEKVDKVRAEMQTKKATLSVFGSLDDVVYLLNMRAKGDVDT